MAKPPDRLRFQGRTELRRSVGFLFATAANLATFAASFAGLFGRETVAAATLVRSASAFASNAALLLGRHSGEAAAALLTNAVGGAQRTLGVSCGCSGSGGSCHGTREEIGGNWVVFVLRMDEANHLITNSTN
jgi:hypothetical protein